MGKKTEKPKGGSSILFKEEPKKPKVTVTDEDPFAMDDLFGSKKSATKKSATKKVSEDLFGDDPAPPKAKAQENAKKKKTEGKSRGARGASLFGDSDDDDLFGSSTKKKSKKAKSKGKSSLFGDSSDEDLFGDSKPKKKKGGKVDLDLFGSDELLI